MIELQTFSGDIKLIKVTAQEDFIVTLCSFGASIYDIQTKDITGNINSITPHPADFDDFLSSRKFYGKTLGRIAGRIKNGRLVVYEKRYQLRQNENNNTLHGGPDSLSFRNFSTKIEENSDVLNVIFTYFSPDQEEGFPGNLDLKITYSIYIKLKKIVITYLAMTDNWTVFNPSNHVYFNLNSDHEENILNHQLFLNASRVSLLEEDLCIHGFREVNRIFDFRIPKLIGQDIDDSSLQNHKAWGYDHTWLIDKFDMQTNAALLISKESGRMLKIKTDLPALNMYSGNYPVNDLLLNRGGYLYRYQALALEPQLIPNDINNWIIEKDKPFLGHICYEFSLTTD